MAGRSWRPCASSKLRTAVSRAASAGSRVDSFTRLGFGAGGAWITGGGGATGFGGEGLGAAGGAASMAGASAGLRAGAFGADALGTGFGAAALGAAFAVEALGTAFGGELLSGVTLGFFAAPGLAAREGLAAATGFRAGGLWPAGFFVPDLFACPLFVAAFLTVVPILAPRQGVSRVDDAGAGPLHRHQPATHSWALASAQQPKDAGRAVFYGESPWLRRNAPGIWAPRPSRSSPPA